MTDASTAQGCAEAVAARIQRLGAGFMFDGATYARGNELGFSGMDFYFRGRGGVLGDVHVDVVAAAFVWFAPTSLALWDTSSEVMPALEAGAHFLECCGDWGRKHLAGFEGAAELCSLGEAAIESCDPAGTPLFAAWRNVELDDDPQARAAQVLHLLRERRAGLHALAVLGTGLEPLTAVLVRGGVPNAQLFGWQPPFPDPDDAARERWAAAESTTNELDARTFEALGANRRSRFAELVEAAHGTAFPG